MTCARRLLAAAITLLLLLLTPTPGRTCLACVCFERSTKVAFTILVRAPFSLVAACPCEGSGGAGPGQYCGTSAGLCDCSLGGTNSKHAFPLRECCTFQLTRERRDPPVRQAAGRGPDAPTARPTDANVSFEASGRKRVLLFTLTLHVFWFKLDLG